MYNKCDIVCSGFNLCLHNCVNFKYLICIKLFYNHKFRNNFWKEEPFKEMRALSGLRKHGRKLAFLTQSMRSMSEQRSLVELSVDKEGIAVLTMQRAPINSQNLEMLQEMSGLLDDAAKLKVKGLILTSAMPTVFSAGLDIMEMYKPDMKRAEQFWWMVQDVSFKLFGTPFATAAAINGHAPAGGCILSLVCEYRAMVRGNYTIGLNEAALGIIATPWIQAAMYHTIPIITAERALTTAKLFAVDEALEIGLIDQTASDKQDAIEKCKTFIRKFENIPPEARALTKQRIREAPLKMMYGNRQEDMKLFLDTISDPEVQKALGVYIERLKQRKKK